MKRKNGLLGILATLCLCMVFTSCHKDEKIAMKLSGEWEGYWGMYYEDRELGQFDSYKSSVVFYPDEKYDTKGKGYQIDWYSQTPNALGNKSPYEKMFYEFTWYVDKKIIYLTYPGHPELNSRIRNYELSKKHFTGYFNNSPTRFDLDSSSPANSALTTTTITRPRLVWLTALQTMRHLSSSTPSESATALQNSAAINDK